MTARDNEALIRRWLDAENAGDLEAVLACFSEDIVFHPLHFQPAHLPAELLGKISIRARFKAYRTTSPDLRFTVDHLVAADDRVAAFGKSTGTHEGAIVGEAPTHRVLTMAWAELYRIADGMIAEVWALDDNAGFWQQLGLIPATSEIFPVLHQSAPAAESASS